MLKQRRALALGLIPGLGLLLAGPALAQSGLRSPTTEGVVHGQSDTGRQDLSSFGQERNAARQRVLRRRRSQQAYTGVAQPPRSTP